MAYIDYKITDWRRIHLPVGVDIPAIIEELSDGRDPADLAGANDWETNDVDGIGEEYLPPEENNAPTVELRDDSGKIIWENYNYNEHG